MPVRLLRQHVPATGEIVDGLVRAGFVDIEIEKLSDTAYFVVDGVSLREVRIVARKRGHRPKATTHQAIYLGPMQQVIDDFGNVFRRGVVTPLNVHDWQVLSKSAAGSAFVLLEAGDSKIGVSTAQWSVPCVGASLSTSVTRLCAKTTSGTSCSAA